MGYDSSDIKEYSKWLEKELTGKRIGKLVTPRPGLFLFRVSDGKSLLLSAIAGSPCLFLGEFETDCPSTNSPMAALLRKKLSGAEIVSIRQISDDRIIEISLAGLNEVYKQIDYSLLIELIPAKPNLILLEEGKIVLAQHMTSLDESRPIAKGLNYLPPRKNFAEPLKNDGDFAAIFDIFSKRALSLLADNSKKRHETLLSLLKRKAESAKKKTKAIEKDVAKASSHIDDGNIGTYILSNLDSIPADSVSISIDGKVVPLDKRLSLARSAERFFASAKKAKKTLQLASANLENAKKEEDEFNTLLFLFDSLEEQTLLELEEHYGLSHQKKKQSEFKTSYLPLQVEIDGTLYLFGRSSKSNEFLTWNLAKSPNFVFMHLKDGHGSHLIVAKDNPSPKELENGACLVLLAAKKEDGEVAYAKKSKIKKGNFPGQVIMNEYESCFIRNIPEKIKKAFGENAKLVYKK